MTHAQAAMASPRASSVERVLSLRDILAIALNSMIGSGMLAAPAKVFHLAGGWSFALLGASALLLTPLILCFVDLASRFDGAGGPYLYSRRALPGWVAFSVAWLLWISQAFSVATLSNLLVSYAAGFAPVLGDGWPRTGLMLAIGGAFTAICLCGIRQSAQASNLLMLLKLGFIVAVVAVGALAVRPARLQTLGPLPEIPTLAQAILVYVYAYMGFERATVMAGESRNPQRHGPAALLAGMAIATVAYFGFLIVCVGGLDNPAANDRPIAEVARGLLGPVGASVVSAGAIIVILGTIQAATVTMPRMLLALAEEGQLPAVFGAVHPGLRTPHVAILLSGAVAFGFAIASDLLSALTFSTATRVLCYLLSCVALLRLSGQADAPAARIKIPGRRSLAVVSIVLLALLLALGAAKELPALAIALALGLGLLALNTLGRRRGMVAP